MDIVYDNANAEDTAKLFYQWLNFEDPILKQLRGEVNRDLKTGRTVLTLPPGNYQFARQRTLRHGSLGHSPFLDRTMVELKPGQRHELSFVRDTGTRIVGVVELPAEGAYEGVLIFIRPETERGPENETASEQLLRTMGAPALDARRAGQYSKDHKLQGKRARFVTDRLPQGKYLVEAHLYKPIPPARLRMSGIIGPDRIETVEVDIPAEGKSVKVRIQIEEADKAK